MCLHNSNCTAPNTCVCTSGYNGSYCQNRKCSWLLRDGPKSPSSDSFSDLSDKLPQWRYLRKGIFVVIPMIIIVICYSRRHHRIVPVHPPTLVQSVANVDSLFLTSETRMNSSNSTCSRLPKFLFEQWQLHRYDGCKLSSQHSMRFFWSFFSTRCMRLQRGLEWKHLWER